MEGLFEKDPYKHIIVQALSDRLAGSCHRKDARIRTQRKSGAYAKDENLSMKDLMVEKYQGIRPAVGYPFVTRPIGKLPAR